MSETPESAQSEEDSRAESADGPAEADRADDYLSDIEDGCGCAEIWEHLSERRGDDD